MARWVILLQIHTGSNAMDAFGETFAEYKRASEATRRPDLKLGDAGVYSLKDAHRIKKEWEGKPRAFSDVATFVPAGWNRKPLIDINKCETAGLGKTVFKLLSKNETHSIVAAGGAVREFIHSGTRCKPKNIAEMGMRTKYDPGDTDYFYVSGSSHQHGEHKDEFGVIRDFIMDASDVRIMSISDVPYRGSGSIGWDIVHLEVDYVDGETMPFPVPVSQKRVKRDKKQDTKFNLFIPTGRHSKIYKPYVASYKYMIMPGIVSTETNVSCMRKIKNQLILRQFNTTPAVISGFDLGASAVAVDLENGVTMTLPGLYTTVFSLMMINDLKCRSTSFANRVVKYFVRGYGVCLPGIDPRHIQDLLDSTEDDEITIEMEDIYLRISKVQPTGMERNMWEASIAVNPTSSAKLHNSGYDYTFGPVSTIKHMFAHTNDRTDDRGLVRPEMIHTRTINITAGMILADPHIRYAMRESRETRDITKLEREQTVRERLANILPTRPTAGALAPSVKEILRAVMDIHHRNLRPCDKRSIYTPLTYALADAIGMDQNIIGKAIMRKENGHIFKCIADHVEANADRYEQSMGNEIELWIRTDPGRQWTMSNDPLIAEASDWYKSMYAGAEYEDAINAAHSHKKECDGDDDDAASPTASPDSVICGICLSTIHKGDINQLILPCGHAFHWTNCADGCKGISKWIYPTRGESNTSCPMCRAPVFKPGQKAPKHAHPSMRTFEAPQ